MIRSFLKGGIYYKTPQLHENASISKDSDIVNKWYVDTKVNNSQINTKQYVDSRVASIPIVDASLFVKINGNQNINGTTFFNSSPTVPNPTAGSHAANKAYVDSKIASGSFSQSFSSHGWTKFPNGLIIQWGRVLLPKNEKNRVQVFPIRFPNAAISVSLTRNNVDMDIVRSQSLSSNMLQPESVTIANAGEETNIYWLVIGY